MNYHQTKNAVNFWVVCFSGKVSSIIGPAVYGTVTLWMKDYGTLASRVALSTLIVMTVVGLLVHLKVNDKMEIASRRNVLPMIQLNYKQM